MVLSNQPDVPIFPPGDLWSDEPPLESSRHLRQLMLLLTSLERYWGDRQDYFAAGNLTIYYSTRERRSEDFRGPDFFVVLDTLRYERKSWVVWEEGGKYPNFLLEVLSASTAQIDRGLKKQIYQDIFRTPDYFWFDPETLEFKGFKLLYGQYEEIQPDERGWRWSEELKLFLGVQEGYVRFFTPEGALVSLPSEAEIQVREQAEFERQRAEAERQRAEAEKQRAEAEKQRAEAERQRAEAEKQRADRLARKLLELGVNLEDLDA